MTTIIFIIFSPLLFESLHDGSMPVQCSGTPMGLLSQQSSFRPKRFEQADFRKPSTPCPGRTQRLNQRRQVRRRFYMKHDIAYFICFFRAQNSF